MEAQIFRALGDPLRLRIVKRLYVGSTYKLRDITEGFGISRQGVRKQIGVLQSANIVKLKPIGREVKVALNPISLKAGKEFITHLENQWSKHLVRLKELVENSE